MKKGREIPHERDHICCAPCSVACIQQLRSEDIEPVGFWYNPNIHPFTEYRARLEFMPDDSTDSLPREAAALKGWLGL